MRKSILPPSLSLAALAAVLTSGAPATASEVLHWNRYAVETTTQALPLDPLAESRILAIVHLAMHDAANTVSPRYATYAPAAPAAPGASFDAAVAAAAHDSLRALLPERAPAIDAEFQHLVLDGPAEARERGLAIGREAARRILGLRRDDGAANVSAWKPGTQPGEYRPTPPDFTPAFASHWGAVHPFALTAPDQFRPAPPPAPGSPAARHDIDVVRRMGGTGTNGRSFEQSEIACYWYEACPQGWNRIAVDLAVSHELDALDQAHLLALVHVTMADGYIAGMEAKYHYHYWRPATAIRDAGDASWLSFLPTPPVPDFPSTHALVGAAAATALAQCLGTDLVSFTMTSGAPFPNITRRFWSLAQAAHENASSRVLAGLHFPSAVEAGYRQGETIGAWTATHCLLPRTNDGLTAANGN